jgi:hypothetical protein
MAAKPNGKYEKAKKKIAALTIVVTSPKLQEMYDQRM